MKTDYLDRQLKAGQQRPVQPQPPQQHGARYPTRAAPQPQQRQQPPTKQTRSDR